MATIQTAIQTVRIPMRLPGLNETIEAAKGAGGNGARYSRIKRKLTDDLVLIFRAAKLRAVRRAFFEFRWVEADRRRDPDNIAAGGRKLILDALVRVGVLKNDGWTQVAGWSDEFRVDARVGVEVVIRELPKAV